MRAASCCWIPPGGTWARTISRWNDVQRTLRGQYGARTTEEIPGDERSTVMYVAAPVRDGEQHHRRGHRGQAQSQRAALHRARAAATGRAGGAVHRRWRWSIGALLSWWLSRAIRRLTRYADAVTAGGVPTVPRAARPRAQPAGRGARHHARAAGGQGLCGALRADADARAQESAGRHPGRRRAAAQEHAARSSASGSWTNIEVETARLQSMSERLLHLAQVEQRRALDEQRDDSAAAAGGRVAGGSLAAGSRQRAFR